MEVLQTEQGFLSHHLVLRYFVYRYSPTWKIQCKSELSEWMCVCIHIWSRRSGNRIPVGARFSATAQTGPGAHPAFYKMSTISFTGVKRPGRGVEHPPPSSTEVKERAELYLYTPSGASWSALGRTLLYCAFIIWSSIYVFVRQPSLDPVPTHGNVIGLSQTTPPPVLSCSSILPPLPPRWAFIRVRKNSARF